MKMPETPAAWNAAIRTNLAETASVAAASRPSVQAERLDECRRDDLQIAQQSAVDQAVASAFIQQIGI